MVILIILAWKKKSFRPLLGGSVALLAYSFDLVLRSLPHILSLKYGEWNWLGTSLSFLWPWVIIYGFKWLTPDQVGLKPHNILYGLIFGLILGGWNIFDGIYFTELPPNPSLNSILFQLFMPGLSEELFYRGLLFAICVHYLGKDNKLLSITLVSLLFMNVHFFDKNGWIGTPDLIANIVVCTTAFAYLRLKTDSIWPGVICHGLINSLPFIAAYF
jgi:membrane protease YdiL (CAAX protease family)